MREGFVKFLQQGPVIDFFSQRPFIEHLLHAGYCTGPSCAPALVL